MRLEQHRLEIERTQVELAGGIARVIGQEIDQPLDLLASQGESAN